MPLSVSLTQFQLLREKTPCLALSVTVLRIGGL